MASKILLKESELISVIKNIVEQAKLEYDELDYMAAFVHIFMDWIRKNTPEKFWSYPFGFLIKKYSKPFLIDMTGADYRNMDDYNNYEISKWDIDRIVKTIVSRGGYQLPSLYSEEKFTEKYKSCADTAEIQTGFRSSRPVTSANHRQHEPRGIAQVG